MYIAIYLDLDKYKLYTLTDVSGHIALLPIPINKILIKLIFFRLKLHNYIIFFFFF